MFLNRRYATTYRELMVESGVTDADPVHLIQMLYNGLLDALSVAEGHIARQAIAEKSQCLTRAGRIVLGLQGALDFENGGEIARNLSELYGYLTRRLLHINLNNDLEALREIRGLVQQIRDAWQLVPTVAGARPGTQSVAKNLYREVALEGTS